MVGVDVFECRAAEFAAKRGILYELPERLAPACRVAGQEARSAHAGSRG